MFKCECGSEEFYAHTAEIMAIKYDGNGDEVDGGEIMEVERPAWNKAYHCVKCDKAYSSLPPKGPEDEWLEKRARKYLDKKGSCCPICESDNIEGVDSLQADGSDVWQEIMCLDCESEWNDIYYLRNVEINGYPTDMAPKVITFKPDPNKEFKR